ncbi:MAG: hypothetical protein ABI164_03695, partial [Acidobacteriaceae bacterium]
PRATDLPRQTQDAFTRRSNLQWKRLQWKRQLLESRKMILLRTRLRCRIYIGVRIIMRVRKSGFPQLTRRASPFSVTGRSLIEAE